MKKTFYTLTVLCGLLFTTTSFSQDSLMTTETMPYKNAVGLHVGLAIGSLFNSNSQDLYPYRLSYRRFFGLNALRLGTGIRFNRAYGTGAIDGNPVNISDSYFATRIGAGYERYHIISNRFEVFYGGEANYFYRFDKEVNEAFGFRAESKRFNHQVGIAPLVGININLSNRFTLSVETLLNFAYSATKDIDSETENGVTTGSTNWFGGTFVDFEFPRGATLRFRF